jgi:hypothetical protein
MFFQRAQFPATNQWVRPMSTESRVEFLLRAAERAEREGNGHLASVLRRMAEELGPGDYGLPVPEFPQTSS